MESLKTRLTVQPGVLQTSPVRWRRVVAPINSCSGFSGKVVREGLLDETSAGSILTNAVVPTYLDCGSAKIGF